MNGSRAKKMSKLNETARSLFSNLAVDEEEREQLNSFLRRECDFLNPEGSDEGLLIFLKDWDGNYLAVNEEMARMYATSADKMTGRGEGDLGVMPPEKADYLLNEDRELMRIKKRQYFPGAAFLDARRQTRLFDVVKTPIVNENGVCVKLLFVARPASESKIEVSGARPEMAARAYEDRPNAHTRKPRILILNDEYLNAIMIKKVLNMEEFEVESIDNVNAASYMAGLKKYDLVLTNEQVLLKGDPEEISALRRAAGKTPIIAMIKKQSEENIKKCKAAGMSNYIEKPFTLSKIIEVIEKYSTPGGRKKLRGRKQNAQHGSAGRSV